MSLTLVLDVVLVVLLGTVLIAARRYQRRREGRWTVTVLDPRPPDVPPVQLLDGPRPFNWEVDG